MKTLFGGSTQKSSSRPEVWEPQAPFMKDVLKESQDLYNAQKGTPGYQGDFYARLNDMQRFTLDDMFSTGGSFANLGRMSALPGAQNLEAGANYGANAQSILDDASMDPSQKIRADAGKYATSRFSQGMVDAATRDAKRAVFENAIPQLNDAASASGNAYSSRTGVTEGIIRRGLGDTVADTSAAIRGDLYRTGLGLAQDQYNRNLSNRLAANESVGNAAQLGSSLINNSAGLVGAGFDMQGVAGNAYQADAQKQLDAAQQRFGTNDMRDWDLLNRYFNFAGWGGGPGQASSSKSSTSTGIVPAILGAGSTAIGMGKLGWI